MAQNLQQLKRRIKTATNIAQIAKAMEMISASKIKKAQKAVEANKPYSERVVNLTSNILNYVDLKKFKHAFIQKNDSEKSLIFVLSPDKGLAGSLTTNLFKQLLTIDSKDNKYVALGKKADLYSQRLSGEYLAGFNFGTTTPDYSVVYRLIEIINEEYLSGKVGSVKILYSKFNSIFSQEPILIPILPIEPQITEDKDLPYLFEPDAVTMLEELLPYFIEVVLYSAVIEAYTSEQAARMVAMQNAKNNALDIADYLTLSYNKSRQERITNELLSLNNNN